MAEVPETQFAWLEEDRIAYQVFGEGPVDLVLCPLAGYCIDAIWDWAPTARFLNRLASLSRVILLDRRGWGASDPVSGETLSSWEAWAEDARAVLDTIGSEQAVILGQADSGPTAIMFAAIHPSRTRGLILGNTTARFLRDDDYPWGLQQADSDRAVELLEKIWGTEDIADFGMPDSARDPAFRRWNARINRLTLNSKQAGEYFRSAQFMDVREVLPTLRVPTLVLHREQFEWITPEQGRYLADRITGATFVQLPGADGNLFGEPYDEILEQIEYFLNRLRRGPEPDRALAAILFTDIVGSTERAAALGDREWRNLVETHDLLARTIVEQHRGRLIRTTGDGMLATFDGPGRAIRCASALRDALRPLGLEIRAGLHTGEIELTGTDIAGIGVHIAARVLDQASTGQLLTSAAVPMLVAGSGLEFEDRGEHALKGVPGPWRLFSVVD